MGVRDRLSYANVMSTVAVFIALGGSAWAISIGRNDVGAREIAKGAVRSSEVGNDKLKGKDVDESSLGEVPSAKRAASAATAETAETAGVATRAVRADAADAATSAETVGGLAVKKFNVRQASPTSAQPVLEMGGLRLTMSCGPGGGDLLASTTKDNSTLFVWGIRTGLETLASEDQEGGDLELGESFDVDDNMGGGGFNPDLGTVLYEHSDGTVVTVDLVTDRFPGPGPTDDCGVAGTAVGG